MHLSALSFGRSLAGAYRSVCGITAVLLIAACGPIGERDAIVFGLAGPFELGYGIEMQRGAEIALREINAAGGVSGRPLAFRTMDDAANPEQAITVAEQLYGDSDVVAVVGHLNSGAMQAAARTYNEGLPAVGTSTTAPIIGQLGPWIFRVASSDSANAVVMARSARGVDGGRSGVLYENNAYGRGLAESFRSALLDVGGSVAGYDPFLETTDDLTPFLERLEARGVQLVFIASTEDATARIISRAGEIGYGTRFMGGDGMEALVGMENGFDGHIAGLMYHPEASENARAFARLYRAEFGSEPDSFSALGYDAVHLVARAVEEVGPRRSAIRDYLAEVGRPGGRPAFDGAAGTVRFDEHGDPVDKPFAIGMIREGGIELVSQEL